MKISKIINQLTYIMASSGDIEINDIYIEENHIDALFVNEETDEVLVYNVKSPRHDCEEDMLANIEPEPEQDINKSYELLGQY